MVLHRTILVCFALGLLSAGLGEARAETAPLPQGRPVELDTTVTLEAAGSWRGTVADPVSAPLGGYFLGAWLSGPSRVLVTHVDGSGQGVWTTAYPLPQSGGRAATTHLTALPDGGVVVAGWEQTGLDLSRLFVLRLNAQGGVVWFRTEDPGYTAIPQLLWANPDGSLELVADVFQRQGGEKVRLYHFGVDGETQRNTVIPTPDTDYRFGGRDAAGLLYNFSLQGGGESWQLNLRRWDPAGQVPQRSTTTGLPAGTPAASLVRTSPGGRSTAALRILPSQGAPYWLVLHYFTDGSLAWSRTLPEAPLRHDPSPRQRPAALVHYPDGSLAVAGTIWSDQGEAGRAVRYSVWGERLWTVERPFPGNTMQCSRILPQEDGGALLAGSEGTRHWIAEVDAEGHLRWEHRPGSGGAVDTLGLFQDGQGRPVAGLLEQFHPRRRGPVLPQLRLLGWGSLMPAGGTLQRPKPGATRFPQTTAGGSRLRLLVLRNRSHDLPLAVRVPQLEGVFRLQGEAAVLQPGESRIYLVSFHPPAAGNYQQPLLVESSDPLAPTLTLTLSAPWRRSRSPLPCATPLFSAYPHCWRRCC